MKWEVEKIGIKIKYLRKQSNITVTELARTVEISQSYLSQIENGQKMIPIDVLLKICNTLGYTLSEFFNDEIDININLKKLLLAAEKLNDEQIQALELFLNTLHRE
jgi:transcriptional regulator with XRE-family HTH domain